MAKKKCPAANCFKKIYSNRMYIFVRKFLFKTFYSIRLKYYIISGEASGDLHGSNLMKAIKQIDAKAEFRFWGGDKMQAQGGTLVTHYRHMAFMGFWEVFTHLFYILKKMKQCKADLVAYKPDALILIDYPGFNLKMAAFAHQHQIKVFYYISPQVWAWKSKRVNLIKQVVDKMFVILPFEQAFYKTWDYPVTYVGHPLLEVIAEQSKPIDTSKRIIALLPGSRKQEIIVKLPIMLSVAKFFPAFQFVVAKAPSAAEEWYAAALANAPANVSTTSDGTYALLQQATAALVTSGTATLETALFGVPQVVCYKGSRLSYEIGKRLVKIKYISLVNLILNKPVVTELIQMHLTTDNLKHELEKLLPPAPERTTMLSEYAQLRTVLGQKVASTTVAAAIYQAIQ